MLELLQTIKYTLQTILANFRRVHSDLSRSNQFRADIPETKNSLASIRTWRTNKTCSLLSELEVLWLRWYLLASETFLLASDGVSKSVAILNIFSIVLRSQKIADYATFRGYGIATYLGAFAFSYAV